MVASAARATPRTVNRQVTATTELMMMMTKFNQATRGYWMMMMVLDISNFIGHMSLMTH
jgi:hypothetical protein